jgi:hypothetical protein
VVLGFLNGGFVFALKGAFCLSFPVFVFIVHKANNLNTLKMRTQRDEPDLVRKYTKFLFSMREQDEKFVT